MFLEKYLPSYMQDQLEMKFLDLRQEDMSVAEYEVKFSELSRFVPEYVNTEVKKAKRIAGPPLLPAPTAQPKARTFNITMKDAVQFVDVVAGMDWLSNHEVQIECKSKKVKLRTKDGDEVIFKGKIQEKKFLTAIQTRRLLHQGCEAYLAHVKDIEEESVRIEDIPVVRDFPDVFPD
ncbi:hypothetical protein AgCh_025720 [Apium graveolens]